MVTGEVKSTLWRLLVVTACMAGLMGATEPGCEPLDRPTDPDDPVEPDDPTDDCQEMVDRCLAAGEPECEAIFDFCGPVEPPPVDPCSEEYAWCLDSGEPPELCDEMYLACIGPVDDPCFAQYGDCLSAGIDPMECEWELEACYGPVEDPCWARYDECLAMGIDPMECEWELEACYAPPVDPCMTQYEECLTWGVDPFECELQLEACYGPIEDPCAMQYDECLAMGMDPFVCDEQYWSCIEPVPPCYDMYERCVAAEPDPAVCDVILIYCEPVPEDPCAPLLAACDELATPCTQLEELFSFCWYEETPSEECQRFFDEDAACWNEVWVCQDAAYAACYPVPEDPCAPLLAECDPLMARCFDLEAMFSFCWYEETPSEECQAFFDEDTACWNEVSSCQTAAYELCYPTPPDPCAPLLAECEPLVEPCTQLEELFSFCWYEETPSEECQRFFDEDTACWNEYSRCYEDAYAVCYPPDPCAEPVAACEPFAAPCYELEAAYEFCWYEETPSDECLAFFDEDGVCWNEYSACVDEAYAGCTPTEPVDRCAWVVELCASGEASPEECELMLAECAPSPEEPPVPGL